MANPYDWIESALTTIHKANWHRTVRSITSLPGPTGVIAEKPVVNFASNDYLGLAGDPRLKAAAIAAIQTYGTGSTGSRLLSGHRPLHAQLEAAIAAWKHTEAAVVFSSGYLANLGTIKALVGGRDVVLGDEYNHASLKNGARLSGATVLDYRHGDMAALRTHLEQERPSYRRCLILTDTVFSMDGDLCPLPELVAISQQFNCMLLVDEAHGTGVFGPTGAGVVEALDCQDAPLIQMGTLSKALGSLGGYVAGSAALIDYLRNRATSWVYTTALSPADTAAALAAIAVIAAEPQRRSQLWQRVEQLKLGLEAQVSGGKQAEIQGRVLPSESAIVCMQLPSPELALAVSQQLWEEGLFVPAIRPPTVPTSRIRISVMATHKLEQIETLVEAIGRIELLQS